VRNKVEVALKQGMISIPDNSGTNTRSNFWYGN
jgi:hypothetical protein